MFSSYKRGEYPYNSGDADRTVDVLEQVSMNRFYQYYSSSNFVDQYGAQMQLYILILIIIGINELVCLCKKPEPKSFLFRMRIGFRWNFLASTLFGSFQSATFYAVLQFIAFSKDVQVEDADIYGLSFACAILIVQIIFPIIVFLRLRQIEKIT